MFYTNELRSGIPAAPLISHLIQPHEFSAGAPHLVFSLLARGVEGEAHLRAAQDAIDDFLAAIDLIVADQRRAKQIAQRAIVLVRGLERREQFDQLLVFPPSAGRSQPAGGRSSCCRAETVISRRAHVFHLEFVQPCSTPPRRPTSSPPVSFAVITKHYPLESGHTHAVSITVIIP